MHGISARYEVGRDRLLEGVSSALFVTGLVLLAVNGPLSQVRSLLIVDFVLNVLPIAVAAILYVRVASETSVVEIAVLVLWAYFALSVSGVIGFFAFGGQSTSYPGELAELTNHVLLFIGTIAVLGGLYMAAATQDKRPLLKWGLVAVVPLGQLVVYAVSAV
ncbi:hypothetical protein C477_04344 [Haloterrigena salina JCM 13891]|uniref:Uncharacterized protein n=1 Tax=Haloterrigena salina JCM 13891 TaxID=1227488 RepID=M0CJ87_9EURY|nr:hypothetical protein C477_04344 [Haloterrigena salina JCM 13891]